MGLGNVGDQSTTSRVFPPFSDMLSIDLDISEEVPLLNGATVSFACFFADIQVFKSRKSNLSLYIWSLTMVSNVKSIKPEANISSL